MVDIAATKRAKPAGNGLALWRDRRGRTSWLRVLALAAMLLPALVTLYDAGTGGLGARPLTEAIHRSGLWMVRLMFLSIAVTPIRRSWRWPELIDIRRMVGVGAFCYGVVHFSLYVVDEGYDIPLVASEIVSRVYLTIGAAALLGLAALAVTSTDGMVRRLGGRNWRRLHLAVYVIAILGIIHYFMQSKLDVFEPTIFAGLLGWLWLYRILTAVMDKAEPKPPILVALTLAAAVLTALGEAYGFNLAYHVPAMRVLDADFGLRTGLRPAWWVLIAGTVIVAGAAYRRLTKPKRRRREELPDQA